MLKCLKKKIILHFFIILIILLKAHFVSNLNNVSLRREFFKNIPIDFIESYSCQSKYNLGINYLMKNFCCFPLMSSNRTRNKNRKDKDKKKEKDSKKNKQNGKDRAIELEKKGSEKKNIEDVSVKAEVESVNDNKKPSQIKQNEKDSVIEQPKKSSEKRNIDNVSAKAEVENVNDNKEPSQSKQSEPKINSHEVDNLPSNSGGHSVTNNSLNQKNKREEVNVKREDEIQNFRERNDNPELEKRKRMVRNNSL